MKKAFKRTALTATAAAYAAVTAGLFLIGSAKVDVTPQNYGGTLTVFAPKDGESFVVRETNGVIGVFRRGVDEPLYTLDVFVFTLPEREQELLRDGIECDAEGLLYLLDSYGS